MRLDELRLIKKVRRNGDLAAADELVRYYYDEIHGFVKKQVSDAGTALDLTQDIFISMLRTIHHFDVVFLPKDVPHNYYNVILEI